MELNPIQMPFNANDAYFAICISNYNRLHPQEINLEKGEIYTIVNASPNRNWLFAQPKFGESGWVPATHLNLLKTQTVYVIHRFRAKNPDEISVGFEDRVLLLQRSLDRSWCHIMTENKQFGYVPASNIGTKSELDAIKALDVVKAVTVQHHLPPPPVRKRVVHNSLDLYDMNLYDLDEEIQNVDMSGVSEMNQKRAHKNLVCAIMKHSGLSKDVCDIIVNYLYFQKQWIEFNAIHDSIYSQIQFIALIINNMLHYVITICLLDIKTSIPLSILSILETVAIIYFYTNYNGLVALHQSIQYMLAVLNNHSNFMIQIFIYMPMIYLLFIVSDNVVLQILYLTFYVITVSCQSYMYYQEINYIFIKPDDYICIHPSLYMLLNILIIAINGMYYESIAYPIVSAIIFYPMLLFVIITNQSDIPWRDRNPFALINFCCLCIENICFFVFGVQLLHKQNENRYLANSIIAFNIIGIFIILTMHSTIFDIIRKISGYYDNYRDQYFQPTINILIDIFVWTPMLIMILYYMFWCNNAILIESWYVIVCIYIIYGYYRIIWSLIECDENDAGFNWIVTIISIAGIKICLICWIMGIIYLSITDKDDYKQNKFRFAMAIIFTAIGSLPWCGLSCFGIGYGCYLCWGVIYDQYQYGNFNIDSCQSCNCRRCCKSC